MKTKAETRDTHPLRTSVVLGVVLTVGGMAWSLFIWPALSPIPPLHYWDAPPDVWHVMAAAHIVAHGKLFLIYRASAIFGSAGFTGQFGTGQYQAGPLLPILLAPVALVGQIFKLSEWVIRWEPRPTMWLVYGPYGLLISAIPFLFAIRSLAWIAGIKRNLLRLQIAAGALVLIPVAVYYGHYDDALSLAFLILSVRDLSEKRWMRAAVMLGIAVGFKQWAWMALPLLLAATPKEHRLRSLLPSAVAPAAFFALALAVDWRFANLALLKADTCPACGHSALWVSSQAMNFVGGPPRLGVFLVAFVVAWRVRGRYDAASLSAALGITLLARLAFEPVVYFYHLAPALALLMVHEELERGRPWRTLVLGGCLLPWWAYYPSMRAEWWAVLGVLVVAIAWPAGKLVFGAAAAPTGRLSKPAKSRDARR